MTMSAEARGEAALQKEEDAKGKVFFHVTYHPKSPPARQIQQAFKEYVLRLPIDPLFNELWTNGQDIPLDAMVIAFHRSHNLENLLSYRKISFRHGPPLSSLLER